MQELFAIGLVDVGSGSRLQLGEVVPLVVVGVSVTGVGLEQVLAGVVEAVAVGIGDQGVARDPLLGDVVLVVAARPSIPRVVVVDRDLPTPVDFEPVGEAVVIRVAVVQVGTSPQLVAVAQPIAVGIGAQEIRVVFVALLVVREAIAVGIRRPDARAGGNLGMVAPAVAIGVGVLGIGAVKVFPPVDQPVVVPVVVGRAGAVPLLERVGEAVVIRVRQRRVRAELGLLLVGQAVAVQVVGRAIAGRRRRQTLALLGRLRQAAVVAADRLQVVFEAVADTVAVGVEPGGVRTDLEFLGVGEAITVGVQGVVPRTDIRFLGKHDAVAVGVVERRGADATERIRAAVGRRRRDGRRVRRDVGVPVVEPPGALLHTLPDGFLGVRTGRRLPPQLHAADESVAVVVAVHLRGIKPHRHLDGVVEPVSVAVPSVDRGLVDAGADRQRPRAEPSLVAVLEPVVVGIGILEVGPLDVLVEVLDPIAIGVGQRHRRSHGAFAIVGKAVVVLVDVEALGERARPLLVAIEDPVAVGVGGAGVGEVPRRLGEVGQAVSIRIEVVIAGSELSLPEGGQAVAVGVGVRIDAAEAEATKRTDRAPVDVRVDTDRGDWFGPHTDRRVVGVGIEQVVHTVTVGVRDGRDRGREHTRRREQQAVPVEVGIERPPRHEVDRRCVGHDGTPSPARPSNRRSTSARSADTSAPSAEIPSNPTSPRARASPDRKLDSRRAIPVAAPFAAASAIASICLDTSAREAATSISTSVEPFPAIDPLRSKKRRAGSRKPSVLHAAPAGQASPSATPMHSGASTGPIGKRVTCST